MRFAAACYLLALSMEENVCKCGPAHALDNTLLVPLLKNSHFYIVFSNNGINSVLSKT